MFLDGYELCILSEIWISFKDRIYRMDKKTVKKRKNNKSFEIIDVKWTSKNVKNHENSRKIPKVSSEDGQFDHKNKSKLKN